MKKRFFVIVLFSVLVAWPAFSQLRVDVGADIPWNIGAAISDFSSPTDTSINVLQNFVFLVPEANVLYQFPLGPVNLGAGLRAFSLILETIAWPNAFAELNLGPVALDLNVGGGVYLLFGLYNHLSTSTVVIPDLSAYFKIGKSFRIGAGGIFFYNLDSAARLGVVPYSIYLSAKFSFTFK